MLSHTAKSLLNNAIFSNLSFCNKLISHNFFFHKEILEDFGYVIQWKICYLANDTKFNFLRFFQV